MIVEYAKHFINHQNFIQELIPHVKRYEELEIRHDKMENLLTNPVALQNYFAQLVELEQQQRQQAQQVNANQLVNVKLKDGRMIQMTVKQLEQLKQKSQINRSQNLLPPGQAPTNVPTSNRGLDAIDPSRRWAIMDALEKQGKIGVKKGTWTF